MLNFASILVCLAALLAPQNKELEKTKEVVRLWPQGLPADAKPLDAKLIAERKKQNSDQRIAIVESPSMTVYPAPKDKANGCAVVICPGGGYNILAWPKEGTEIAEWFNSIGVTAFVLKYRVPRRDPQRIHWEPMQDVQRAIRLARQGKDKWKIASDRIGVLGFSAGGHLSVMAGVQYDQPSYPRVDAADDLSCRPDFMCPIYAAYLGNDYRDDVVELGTLVNVTKKTPPTFLAVTWDDKMRGAQSALLFAQLKKNGVPAEIHSYTKGGHGYGIRPTNHPVSLWHLRLAEWLDSMELLIPKK